MQVQIFGLSQGSINVNIEVVPRVGETLTVLYGPDAEVKGVVHSVHHHINQHADEHKINIEIRAFD